MGQNQEHRASNTGRIAFYGVVMIILIAIPALPHPLRVILFAILSVFSGVALNKWHKRRYSAEDDRDCPKTTDTRTLNCNRCGHLIGPSYMGKGQPEGRALWKYICLNCGLRWDEYWHLPPHDVGVEAKLGS